MTEISTQQAYSGLSLSYPGKRILYGGSIMMAIRTEILALYSVEPVHGSLGNHTFTLM